MPSVVLPVRPEGLILLVQLNHSKPKLDALKAASQPVPAWEAAVFMVDTGASHTMICKSLAKKLGLVASGVTPIHTVSSGSTPVQCNTYDVAMYIPGMSGAVAGHFVEAIPVTESDFTAQNFNGLLGRDVLKSCVLTYIGHTDQFVLSY